MISSAVPAGNEASPPHALTSAADGVAGRVPACAGVQPAAAVSTSRPAIPPAILRDQARAPPGRGRSVIPALWPRRAARARKAAKRGAPGPGLLPAQRMYSSPASYSVNSVSGGTSAAIPEAWNAGNSCSACEALHVRPGLPHGHHVQAVLVRAGRPGEQAVDVLGRVVPGRDRAEVFDAHALGAGDVNVGHCVLPFGVCVCAGVCAGRNDATENPGAGHPGKYSAEYSFTVGSGPRGDLAAVAEPELDQDVLHVVLRRPLGDEQGLPDLLVGQPPRHQPGHLDLAGTQR